MITASLPSTAWSDLVDAMWVDAGLPREGTVIRRLYRGPLPDSLEILLVDAPEGGGQVVALYSPVDAPRAALDAARRAKLAAAALGRDLARRVVQPLWSGTAGGRTYAVVPHLLELPNSKILWAVHRRQVAAAVMDWLFGAARQTSRPVTQRDCQELFCRTLDAVEQAAELDASIRRQARLALDRLLSGAWQPRTCLMHGDLWRGNLMLRPDSVSHPRWADRLVVIDWGGARVTGYPFFDLCRAADSLKVCGEQLRKEMARHCDELGCAPVDGFGYVLAACGSVLLEPGFFPRERIASFVLAATAGIRNATGLLS